MRKLYSLIDKIYRKENLFEAFRRVKRNHGAPGIDGETVEDFAAELDERIEFLHGALKTNTYTPSPRIYFPVSRLGLPIRQCCRLQLKR